MGKISIKNLEGEIGGNLAVSGVMERRADS